MVRQMPAAHHHDATPSCLRACLIPVLHDRASCMTRPSSCGDALSRRRPGATDLLGVCVAVLASESAHTLPPPTPPAPSASQPASRWSAGAAEPGRLLSPAGPRGAGMTALCWGLTMWSLAKINWERR